MTYNGAVAAGHFGCELLGGINQLISDQSALPVLIAHANQVTQGFIPPSALKGRVRHQSCFNSPATI